MIQQLAIRHDTSAFTSPPTDCSSLGTSIFNNFFAMADLAIVGSISPNILMHSRNIFHCWNISCIIYLFLERFYSPFNDLSILLAFNYSQCSRIQVRRFSTAATAIPKNFIVIADCETSNSGILMTPKDAARETLSSAQQKLKIACKMMLISRPNSSLLLRWMSYSASQYSSTNLPRRMNCLARWKWTAWIAWYLRCVQVDRWVSCGGWSEGRR